LHASLGARGPGEGAFRTREANDSEPEDLREGGRPSADEEARRGWDERECRRERRGNQPQRTLREPPHHEASDGDDRHASADRDAHHSRARHAAHPGPHQRRMRRQAREAQTEHGQHQRHLAAVAAKLAVKGDEHGAIERRPAYSIGPGFAQGIRGFPGSPACRAGICQDPTMSTRRKPSARAHRTSWWTGWVALLPRAPSRGFCSAGPRS